MPHWYQTLHRLPLVEQLMDGKPQAVRAYLAHFWSYWSGPSYAVDDEALDHLVDVYGAPGRSPHRSPGIGQARGRS